MKGDSHFGVCPTHCEQMIIYPFKQERFFCIHLLWLVCRLAGLWGKYWCTDTNRELNISSIDVLPARSRGGHAVCANEPMTARHSVWGLFSALLIRDLFDSASLFFRRKMRNSECLKGTTVFRKKTELQNNAANVLSVTEIAKAQIFFGRIFFFFKDSFRDGAHF